VPEPEDLNAAPGEQSAGGSGTSRRSKPKDLVDTTRLSPDGDEARFPEGPFKASKGHHVTQEDIEDLGHLLTIVKQKPPYRSDAALARAANVGERTVRDAMTGEVWPDLATVARLMRAVNRRLTGESLVKGRPASEGGAG
jgi:DNA-binding phage protein